MTPVFIDIEDMFSINVEIEIFIGVSQQFLLNKYIINQILKN